jgi:hypothetical protein
VELRPARQSACSSRRTESVIQNVGDKLNLAVLSGCGRARSLGWVGSRVTRGNELKQIRAEHDAQHQQHQRAANPETPAAKPSATALVAAIFNIVTSPTSCPALKSW